MVTTTLTDTPAGAVKTRTPVLPTIAIGLLSWTFPRIAAFKLTDIFAMLLVPKTLVSKASVVPIIRCYWPFMLGTIYSLVIAAFMIGRGDFTLGSNKGIYASPALISFTTLLHIIVYLLDVMVLSSYFSCADDQQISKTLIVAYYLTLFPGLLQLFRIYSHHYFSIPFFERGDVGPFSGVFDAGYALRLMGFEFEPLAYATSLVVVCCLSMYNGRRVPWLGLVVLLHTLGAGAIGGLLLAMLTATSRRLTKIVIPFFALGFAAVCWFVYTHIRALLALGVLSGSVMERLGATYACTAMWLAHPLGVGLGLYGYFFNRFNVSDLFMADRLDFYPNNDPGMFLAYGGILYLAGYLWTFHYTLRRSRSWWLTVATLTLLFQSPASYLFFNPAIVVVFSLLLAGTKPPAVPMRKEHFTVGPLRQFPFGMRISILGRHNHRNTSERGSISQNARLS